MRISLPARPAGSRPSLQRSWIESPAAWHEVDHRGALVTCTIAISKRFSGTDHVSNPKFLPRSAALARVVDFQCHDRRHLSPWHTRAPSTIPNRLSGSLWGFHQTAGGAWSQTLPRRWRQTSRRRGRVALLTREPKTAKTRTCTCRFVEIPLTLTRIDPKRQKSAHRLEPPRNTTSATSPSNSSLSAIPIAI
jgi:hypothetical protein